jgi:hypothetical protein
MVPEYFPMASASSFHVPPKRTPTQAGDYMKSRKEIAKKFKISVATGPKDQNYQFYLFPFPIYIYTT